MMITRSRSQNWSNKAFPSCFLGGRQQPARRAKGYKIEAASYALFFGALEAKRAKWLSKRFHLTAPTIALPSENVAAIKLLDSWLSTPDVERDEWQERLERLIEENRL